MSTSKPVNREEFKEFCLRRLGAPLLEINVADEQIEDCVETALQYYHDYHFDGTQKIFVSYKLTQTDIDNKWIPIPESVIGIANVLPIGASFSVSTSMFDVRYQLALNDLMSFRYGDVAPYYMYRQNIELIQQLFVGVQPIRYNRHVNKLYLDTKLSDIVVPDDYVVVEAYESLDPETYTDVWNDRWLKRYATAQIKKQWGENLKKFDGIQMPGGVVFNGQKIWDEATEEIRALEEEMIISYSLPVNDMIG